MSSFALGELNTLRSFAARRLANPHGQQLVHYLDGVDWAEALKDRPLAPWDMSLGFHTPYWSSFTEEQRLALNHWTYAMMYFRIGDGERFVVCSNRVVADLVESQERDLAGLLRLETDEEIDHIKAFGRVFSSVQQRHGFVAAKMPVKPLRPFIVNDRFIRLLVGAFGADFVVTYYFGRGLVNHMGKAFETKVATLDGGSPALAKLSMLHTVDENRHMAVSRMMAACAYELLHRRRNRSALYEAANHVMQKAVLRYTFSDRITTGQERAMSHAMVPQMKTLAGIERQTLTACIDAHFDGVTGIEHAKNAFMPKFNQRLMERACLSGDEKRMWFDVLNGLQRNLEFFPKGWRPGDGLVTEAFDDEGPSALAS
ncbi:MAG: hypothetical protein GQE15_06010 [Archangiaceae bacterium]|nr:hypothetical protein [Archangiaceae bacterium]